MKPAKQENYENLSAGSAELVERLVNEHAGWASAIARSVARAWNLDWQLDGLDGGAYEGLVFCARRFDPSLGIPFRAYARRRIHEASTEEARKSKSWQKGVGSNTEAEQVAREISYGLFQVFPELRDGLLPIGDGEGDSDDSMRGSVRQLLASASVLATLHEMSTNNSEAAVDYKRMLEIVAELDTVHQEIVWGVYWQGKSMRALAEEWETDELNVIREHKSILEFLSSRIANKNKLEKEKLKIRPGLRPIAQKLKRSNATPPFGRLAAKKVLALSLLTLTPELMSIFQTFWEYA